MVRYKTKIWWAHFLNYFRSANLDMVIKEKQLVFGLGTGRSGTSSLGELLNLQESYAVSHERKPILAWRASETELNKKLNQIAGSAAKTNGDVASSYLPFAEKILETFPRSKFICLQRDKQETVKSFMRKTGDRNHWTEHDGKRWKKDYWDRFFPKYQMTDKAKAIEQYWIDYYQESERLAKQYPQRFKIFPISVLSNMEEQKALFDFLEISDPKFQVVRLDKNGNELRVYYS
jgi:hypothetical protein